MEAITTPPVNGHTRELVELPLHDLALDPVINRSVDERWVSKLAEGFNPLALGLFTVWKDGNGEHKIVDGQHRYRAAALRGYDQPVACYVHHGLDEAQAAELFLEINSQRNVSAIDKFRKAVQAGHQQEVAVAAVLADYGLQVGTASGDIGSPTVLLQIHTTGGDTLLRELIDTLLGAFSDMPRAQALHGEVLSSLLYALRKYGRPKVKKGEPRPPYRLELAHMRLKLGEISMVELFANRDVKHRESPQYNKRWHLAGQLVEIYNRGEGRSRRLEAWSYRAA
jgi:hypothetical protein